MRALRRILFALSLTAAAAAASGEVQKKTLLTADGVLYQVQTGTAADLALADLPPSDYVVLWSTLAQDGTLASGLIPGTAGSSPKTSLDLTVDEQTGTLVVLWREENNLLNQIRLAFGKSGNWTVAGLLPNVGFPHAYNPQMLLTHQTVHLLDDEDADVYQTRSVLSVIWWEEAGLSQARYASFFLDETIDPSAVEILNLPELVNDAGPTSLQDLPRGAYAFPALQSSGMSGDVIASFATASSDKQYVVRLTYPTDLGKPGPDNITWLRRRAPIVGIVSIGPMSYIAPLEAATVHTVVGNSYKPTLYWGDDLALHYIRFDGTNWSDMRSITYTPDIDYGKAVALVEEMARRN